MAVHYEEGKYAAEITAQRLTTNRNGNTQLEIEFMPYSKIEEVESKSLTGSEVYPRTIYMVITEKSGNYVIDRLRMIGWPGTSFKTLDAELCPPDKFHNFVGSSVTVWCRHKVYLEQQREEWQLAVVEGAKERKANATADKATARKLDTLFGKHLKETAKNVLPDDGNLPPKDRDVDDIPF